MKYNYINGEVTNEKEFINDDEMMIQEKMYEYERIPSIETKDGEVIWYLQQGMTLLLVKRVWQHFKEPFINYIAIEQEVKRNEMAIKEIHSAIQIPDDDKQLLMYYNTKKEKESIKMNVQEILSKLKFIKENEIEYMCSKIDEFFTKPVEEVELAEVTKPADKKYTRTWDSASKTVEYNGKQYTSMNSLFKGLGIRNQNYYYWINKGLSQNEAIEKCIEIKTKQVKKPTTADAVKGKTKLYSYLGETLTLGELGKLSGINSDVIWHRLKSGWSVADAVETPVKER